MNSRAWSICFVTIATLGTLPGVTASAAKRPRSVLGDVAALDKRVTYTETKIPLGELIQRIAAETGTSLTAARDVADEPVAAVVRDLPARELLEQLADLLDYRWSRRSGVQAFGRSGVQVEPDALGAKSDALPFERPNARTSERLNAVFEIWQDLAAKQREEALRQAARLAAERRFRQEVERYTRLAALSDAQIQRLLEAEERHGQELEKLPPEVQHALRDTTAEKERAQQLKALQRLRSPIDRMLASLLDRLSGSQWTLLFRGVDLAFATGPQPGDLRLPSAITRVFRANVPIILRPGSTLTIMNGDTVIPPGSAAWQEAFQKFEQGLRKDWAAATGYRVKLRVHADTLQTGGSLSLSAAAYSVLGGTPPRFSAQGGSLTISTGGAETAAGTEMASAAEQVGLETDPVLGTPKPFQPEVKPRAVASGPGSGSAWRLRDLLPDLARTYGVSLIADAYAGAPAIAPQQIAGSEPIPLFALLDRLVGTTHRWDRRDGLIRLRSRSWFFDRSREIPLRLVRHWQALFVNYGALPLETYLEMTATLTERQLEGVGSAAMEAGLPRDCWDVYLSRRVLRLYASLPLAQREALWQGRALPLAQMGRAQQALLLAAVRDRAGSRPIPVNLAPWSAATFSLTLEPRVRIREQPRPGEAGVSDDWASPGFREEPLPTPTGASADAASVRSASAALGAVPGTGVPASGAPQAREPSPPTLSRPNTATGDVTRHPILRLLFRLQASPDLRETFFLKVAAP